MTTAIWWIRRDLRLFDNQALKAAIDTSAEVVPVFILDDILLASPYMSQKRLAFLLGGLRDLDHHLTIRQSRLIIRKGDPIHELARLVEETQAKAVFSQPDVSPYAGQRDAQASEILPMQWVGSPAVLPPSTVLKSDGSPYTVFTPFSRAWKERFFAEAESLIPAPAHISTDQTIPSETIPNEPLLPTDCPFPPTLKEALQRLNFFTSKSDSGIESYAQTRDRLDVDGTSQLSPYLRFGMISAREAAVAAQRAFRNATNAEARKSAETWLNELIWREFYLHILYHFPRVRRENFRLPHVRWKNNPQDFEAWCAGRTGYPVVDAALQQLIQSGWMHNRARMIVASFLTKDLLVDWRLGEKFFMQHLIDGDPAANNGGWQWSAGTGTDAAPYFRVFNPITQSLRFDPEGDYIRKWLPALRTVPVKYIHAPWEMPEEVQVKAGCRIGQDYPNPIVDHSQARLRALEAYGQ